MSLQTGTSHPSSSGFFRGWWLMPLSILLFVVLLNPEAHSQEGVTLPDTPGTTVAQPVTEREFIVPLVRTESPRQTLSTFLHLRDALETALRSYELDRTLQNAEHLSIISQHLRSLIDLSGVSEGSRRQVGLETLGYLLNILGRTGIPNLDKVPDGDAFSETEPAIYRIPDTPLQIVRMGKGAQWGEFLFSQQTIQVAPRFDRGIRNLPLQTTLPIKSWVNLMPQITGPLFPSVDISALPDSLKAQVLDTPIWKAISVVTISLIATLLFIWWQRALDQVYSEKRLTPLLLRIIRPVSLLAVVAALNFYFDTQVVATGALARLIDFVYAAIFFAAAAWAFWLVVLAFFEGVVVDPRFPDQSLDANMLRLIAKIVGAVGGILILAYGAQDMGVPVLTMVTGLGIGGIAVALAIRPTLENLIGGFILYFDKPVKVGDFCNFGDMSGTVETIGIRSTQVRSLDRTLISIPNSQFVDMQLINWARCDQMMITHTIGLRYETEADQLRYVLAKIREMFHSHPRIDPETIRVRFSGYGASSLDVSIRVYAKTREWNDFYAIKEDILLRIGDVVKQSGTGFAFPSQTVYMGKDEGLDTKLGEKAKAEVAAWRRNRQLPFPKFADSKLEKLAAKLDYPPRGSPDFNATEEELAEGSEPLSVDPTAEDDNEQLEEQKSSKGATSA
ncbi:MAG: mechanosensitive ion channel family protein [Anderseniella sp.]|jgi:MscS family membrane protein|nr:mechanosensitive ion channel family protein [Anderseniella sp.]